MYWMNNLAAEQNIIQLSLQQFACIDCILWGRMVLLQGLHFNF